MPMGASWARTRWISVVFPAPDGPETMNNVPSGWKLLDILYLLADPLDLGLQFYNDGSQHRRARLRAHGVHFAQHLLRDEVELLARRLLAADDLLDRVDVVGQPGQLLGDVPLLHHQDHFLGDAVLVDLDARGPGDLLHPLLVRGEQLGADLLAIPGELLLQLADARRAGGDVGVQRLPFPRAHGPGSGPDGGEGGHRRG